MNLNALLLQIPRLYNVYKEQGLIDNFEQLLDNIFHPLFEVTRDPNSHPQLHLFLKTVGCWSAYVPLLYLHLKTSCLKQELKGVSEPDSIPDASILQ